MDATNSDRDAVIRQKGGCRWSRLVHGSLRDGILQGKGQSEGHAEGLRLTGVVGG